MKLLLIQPKMELRPMDTGIKIRMSPPLGLYTIVGLLPKEIEVQVVNENVETLQQNILADLVGISITVDVMPRAIQLSAAFRKRGIPVVAGGIHITAAPDQAAAYFDVICTGAAEDTWPQIVQDFEKGVLKPRYDSALQCGSALCAPAYAAIPQENYLFTNVMTTSRGCPFACDFCYNSCEGYAKLYFNRPVEEILKEVQGMGTRHILFVDDNFIGNPAWTRELLEKMRPYQIKWSAAVSANLVEMPDLITLMAQTGCQGLFIGFESLTEQAVSDVHKKQNHIAQYDVLVDMLHAQGIMVHASFVFGLDGDDVSVFSQTLHWIVEKKIETVTSHILTPYPGTALYDRLKQAGRITDENLAHYNTAHVVYQPKGMSPEVLYQGYVDFYKQVYSTKNILRRLPRAKREWASYLLFNFLYRKFGKVTDALCRLLTYQCIGKWARRISYHLK